MMRAVAEHLGVAVNSVTSIADGMERKGLLRRVRSESDRRVVHVELTEAGLEASRSVMGMKNKFHRELLAALTEEEQAILLVLLRKVGGWKAAETMQATQTAELAVTHSHTNGRAVAAAASSPRSKSGRRRSS